MGGALALFVVSVSLLVSPLVSTMLKTNTAVSKFSAETADISEAFKSALSLAKRELSNDEDWTDGKGADSLKDEADSKGYFPLYIVGEGKAFKDYPVSDRAQATVLIKPLSKDEAKIVVQVKEGNIKKTVNLSLSRERAEENGIIPDFWVGKLKGGDLVDSWRFYLYKGENGKFPSIAFADMDGTQMDDVYLRFYGDSSTEGGEMYLGNLSSFKLTGLGFYNGADSNPDFFHVKGKGTSIDLTEDGDRKLAPLHLDCSDCSVSPSDYPVKGEKIEFGSPSFPEIAYHDPPQSDLDEFKNHDYSVPPLSDLITDRMKNVEGVPDWVKDYVKAHPKPDLYPEITPNVPYSCSSVRLEFTIKGNGVEVKADSDAEGYYSYTFVNNELRVSLKPLPDNKCWEFYYIFSSNYTDLKKIWFELDAPQQVDFDYLRIFVRSYPSTVDDFYVKVNAPKSRVRYLRYYTKFVHSTLPDSFHFSVDLNISQVKGDFDFYISDVEEGKGTIDINFSGDTWVLDTYSYNYNVDTIDLNITSKVSNLEVDELNYLNKFTVQNVSNFKAGDFIDCKEFSLTSSDSGKIYLSVDAHKKAYVNAPNSEVNGIIRSPDTNIAVKESKALVIEGYLHGDISLTAKGRGGLLFFIPGDIYYYNNLNLDLSGWDWGDLSNVVDKVVGVLILKKPRENASCSLPPASYVSTSDVLRGTLAFFDNDVCGSPLPSFGTVNVYSYYDEDTGGKAQSSVMLEEVDSLKLVSEGRSARIDGVLWAENSVVIRAKDGGEVETRYYSFNAWPLHYSLDIDLYRAGVYLPLSEKLDILTDKDSEVSFNGREFYPFKNALIEGIVSGRIVAENVKATVFPIKGSLVLEGMDSYVKDRNEKIPSDEPLGDAEVKAYYGLVAVGGYREVNVEDYFDMESYKNETGRSHYSWAKVGIGEACWGKAVFSVKGELDIDCISLGAGGEDCPPESSSHNLYLRMYLKDIYGDFSYVFIPYYEGGNGPVLDGKAFFSVPEGKKLRGYLRASITTSGDSRLLIWGDERVEFREGSYFYLKASDGILRVEKYGNGYFSSRWNYESWIVLPGDGKVSVENLFRNPEDFKGGIKFDGRGNCLYKTNGKVISVYSYNGKGIFDVNVIDTDYLNSYNSQILLIARNSLKLRDSSPNLPNIFTPFLEIGERCYWGDFLLYPLTNEQLQYIKNNFGEDFVKSKSGSGSSSIKIDSVKVCKTLEECEL